MYIVYVLVSGTYMYVEVSANRKEMHSWYLQLVYCLSSKKEGRPKQCVTLNYIVMFTIVSRSSLTQLQTQARASTSSLFQKIPCGENQVSFGRGFSFSQSQNL